MKNILLHLCCFAAMSGLLPVTSALSQDDQPQAPASRRVTGQEAAAGSQVLINEINTEQFPKVRIFATVLKDGTPVKGLSASDFRVREDEVDQEPLAVEPKLPALSVVVTIDTSGSMKRRLGDVQAAAKSFIENLGASDSAQVVSFA